MQVFSEDFLSVATDSALFSHVAGVLATPPTTNSAAIAPVDMAITRNSDLQLLHELTVEEEVAEPLDDLNWVQRRSLLKAMAIPQVINEI